MSSISRRSFVGMAGTVAAGAVLAGCSSASSSDSSSSSSSSSSDSSSSSEAKVLTGGGSNLVYVITPSVSNPAFKCEADAAAAKVKELGYEVKCVSHDDDVNKQSELFDNAIADKAAGIICDNAGADATVTPVKKAYDANIPTVLIDREINETGIAIAQIVANNYQGAQGIAEEFVTAMGEAGEYAELKGKESDTNAGVRSSAFHEIIDQYPDLKLVDTQVANWEQTEAFEKTETILQSNPNLKGIICGNDTMAMGAIAACEGKDIKVIGVDGSDEAAAQIKAGKMVGTAMQPFFLIAQTAAEQLDAYLKNGSTGEDEKQLIDCAIVTSANVDKMSNFTFTE